jgi:hypothetical protein
MHGGQSGGMGAGAWGDRYGTTTPVTRYQPSDKWSSANSGAGDTGHRPPMSIAWTFADFLLSARHVLADNGVILAKIGDQTHNARQQWEHCRLWSAALACGLTPCDLMVKLRAEPKRRDPKHQHQYHLDKVICFFLVIRNGADNC